MEGLRISPQPPAIRKPVITRDKKALWDKAVIAYKRDGNFTEVLKHCEISDADMQAMIKEASNV